MTARSAQNSQQCHKWAYFLQYSRFASKYLRFEHGAPICFLSQAPSDLITPLTMMSQENVLDQCTSNQFCNFDDNVHSRADMFLWSQTRLNIKQTQ